MQDDIILNKITIIERCIKRIQEEYYGFEEEFEEKYTKQDAVILNIQRACEASIDLANHIIRIKKWGIPQSSKDVFTILNNNKIIDKDLTERLQKMVGFRNIAVHDYQNLDLNIIKSIIINNLTDLLKFTGIILENRIQNTEDRRQKKE